MNIGVCRNTEDECTKLVKWGDTRIPNFISPNALLLTYDIKHVYVNGKTESDSQKSSKATLSFATNYDILQIERKFIFQNLAMRV